MLLSINKDKTFKSCIVEKERDVKEKEKERGRKREGKSTEDG